MPNDKMRSCEAGPTADRDPMSNARRFGTPVAVSDDRRREILAAAAASQARRSEENRARAASFDPIPLGPGNTISRIARDLNLPGSR